MTNARSARLLVVDDEEALTLALCNILAQQGYETVGCTSAADALAKMESARFDLLLTDMRMAGINGLSLVSAALARDPTMVTVMMTGQGSIENAVEAMQVGVLDYVLKPFKVQTMLPILERALALRSLRLQNASLNERLLACAAELETANRELEACAAAVSPDPRDRSAQRLVADLLRLSRLGRQPLLRRPVDVTRLAREVVDGFALSATDAAPAMSVDSGMTAQADADLLRQVFVNLVDNAIKSTRQTRAASIRIGHEPSDAGPVFFVIDNGPGFDMRLADRLFQPFERLPDAEGHEGSGVGLSIVKRIVLRHGGRTWADASPGRGARFSFTLEAASGAGPALVATEAGPVGDASVPALGSGAMR